MKVLHITRSVRGDGVSLAGLRLHQGLRELGVDSQLFAASGPAGADGSDISLFRPSRDLKARIIRRGRKLLLAAGSAYERTQGHPHRANDPSIFADDRSIFGDEMLRQMPSADIVHQHAITDWIDFRAFFSGIKRSPIVRTLHDMIFFTGGCHHDEGCGRYTARCGSCPQLGSRRDADLSRRIWERKEAAFSSLGPDRLHLIAPNKWIARAAAESSLVGRFPVSIIPFGVDTETFAPRERDFARDVLGIDRDASVMLFVADPVGRYFKGYHLLARALEEHLHNVTKPILLTVGSVAGTVPVRIPLHHMGRVENARLMSLIYSAADVYVIPSIADNSPQTVLESMACGTPVAGFAVGGVPEMVETGKAGILVSPRDLKALQEAIQVILADPVMCTEMGQRARSFIERDHTLSLQAQRHILLYKSMMSGTAVPTDFRETSRPVAWSAASSGPHNQGIVPGV